MGQSWKTSHLFLGWLPEPISRFRPNTESADFCRQQERVTRTVEILRRLIDRQFGVAKDLNSFGASIKQQLETFAEGFILRLIVSASVLETDGKLIPCPRGETIKMPMPQPASHAEPSKNKAHIARPM